MHRSAFLFPAAWLLAAAAPAHGQPAGAEPTPTLHGELRLSLDDAIKMGLENNLDVEVERHAPLIARDDESIAWGGYEPELFIDGGYAVERDPNAFTLNAQAQSKTERWDGVGGLRGLLPYTGTGYDLSFDSSRTKTNSTVQSLSPELRASFELSLTQPLLRDLLWNREWTRVKTSRVAYRSSLEEFRRAVMDTVSSIEDAYWTLIAEDEQVRVARKSLQAAQALLDQTGTQYEVGVVSKVEVTEAEAGVAQREVDLIRADNRYRNQQDVLIDLVLGSHLAADSTLEIEATDRAEDFIEYQIDVADAVRKAFALRPELAAAQREIERNEFEVKFAKNQRLPQLDGTLAYGNRGLAGSQNVNNRCAFLPPTAVVESPPGSGMVTTITPRQDCLDDPSVNKRPSSPYGRALEDFFEEDAADQISFRGMFSIPLGNTAGRRTVSKRELELRRAKVQKRRLEQTIIVEVRRSARDLLSSQEGIEAAERARLAAAEQLRAEEIRLEYGESTPFDVLLREEDLVEAESEKINALRVYRVSATALDRAQGTILRNRNIRIDRVTALR